MMLASRLSIFPGFVNIYKQIYKIRKALSQLSDLNFNCFHLFPTKVVTTKAVYCLFISTTPTILYLVNENENME